MSKLLMTTDSDTKTSNIKPASGNTVYNPSNRLSQLSSGNNLQVPLKIFKFNIKIIEIY